MKIAILRASVAQLLKNFAIEWVGCWLGQG